MAEPKKPSLTVLGGPMAGTKFLLPEPPASILVGSDLACHFRLELPGVSPTHAYIAIEDDGVTIDRGESPEGLHVNDNPVIGPTSLGNGDIIWLGAPGEADVVMLQCVLPPHPEPEVAETAFIPPEVIPAEPAAPTPDAFMIEEPPSPSPAAEEPALFIPAEEASPLATEEAATDATVIMAEAAEEPIFTEPVTEPDETLRLGKPAPAPASPEPPPPPPPAAPAVPAPRPARPSPTGTTAPVAPRPRTQALPRQAPAPPPKASSPVGLYAAIGVGALLVLGGGAYAVWRFLLSPKPAPPAITEAELRQAVAPTPAPVATPVATPVPVLEPTPAPVAATSPPPPALPTPAAAPTTAPPTPRPSASPSAAASPKESPKAGATPAPPSAEMVRAQQVAGLLGQAEAALAARQYDQAIAHLDEALRLDPQNPKAAADRAAAVAQRDAGRRAFVAGRTAVRSEKASAGGLAGFEGADVRTPDFQGRIEFEMTPASGLKPGDSYNLKLYVVNEGRKAIKIVGVTATTAVNGGGSGGAIAPRVKQVEPQQRALLGEVAGAWKDGTTSWSTEVLVTANKGDTLRNTLSWR